jgi:hypothetical protein
MTTIKAIIRSSLLDRINPGVSLRRERTHPCGVSGL